MEQQLNRYHLIILEYSFKVFFCRQGHACSPASFDTSLFLQIFLCPFCWVSGLGGVSERRTGGVRNDLFVAADLEGYFKLPYMETGDKLNENYWLHKVQAKEKSILFAWLDTFHPRFVRVRGGERLIHFLQCSRNQAGLKNLFMPFLKASESYGSNYSRVLFHYLFAG